MSVVHGSRMSLAQEPDGRVAVRSTVHQGGREVHVQTDEQWAEVSTEPRSHYPTCRYETVVTVYRIPPIKPPYEAGPVPGSLW